QGLSFVIGDNAKDAEEKSAYYDEYISEDGYAAHAAIVDLDGRAYPPDTPLREIRTNTAHGFLEWLAKDITDRQPPVGDEPRLRARSNRIVGTPSQIADRLAQWQAAGVDGINVINWVIPGSYEEFAELLIPELQDRGLAQTEYTEGTLRRKLFGTDRLNER